MKPIKVIKFRTMTNKRDKNGVLLPDEQRVTKYGKFLRSTSLDELPQLLNIIFGHMSVVGPRPLPPEYDSYYRENEKARFFVRPGLIQPEVLHKEILPSWDDQLFWESEYAKKINFMTDMRIFFAVFGILFKRSKSNYGGVTRKSLIEERGSKKMIVSIHQPDFIPWLGFYYKVAHSDVFVYLDDAQFSNEAAHNFNKIKTPQGELKIKIPVNYHFKDLIKDVRVKNDSESIIKMLRTIEMNYSRATFFHKYYPEFRDIILHGYETIADLNIAINDWIFKGFGIKTKVVRSSTLSIASSREERVIDICLALKGNEYLSGNGARAYQTEEHFTNKGLKLTYLDYSPIEYKQLWGSFLPCMSVIDYIFNCGFDWEDVESKVRRINNK